MSRPEDGRLPDELMARIVGGLDEAGTLRWGFVGLETGGWWSAIPGEEPLPTPPP